MFVQIFECCYHCCELLREFRSVHVDLCNIGSSRSFGILDGLLVLYCLKSGTCRMTSNYGRPLLSQCKMVGSATHCTPPTLHFTPPTLYFPILTYIWRIIEAQHVVV